MESANRIIEEVARASYGRLLAYLSSRTRDVAGAEDALADALLAALSTWPKDGVPKNPEGWLLTSARHRLIDRARHAQVQQEHAGEVERLLRESHAGGTADEVPDERLKLFFV